MRTTLIYILQWHFRWLEWLCEANTKLANCL